MSQNTSARAVAQTLQLGINMVSFALDNEPQDANIKYCPLGLSIAMGGMMGNGMDGGAWTQTRDSLSVGQASNHKELTGLYSALLSYLTAEQLGVKFNLAQGIWADRGVPLEAGFLLANRPFKAELRNCNFGDPEYVLNHALADGEDSKNEGVNPWVRRQTMGMIDEVLKELSPDDFLIVVSALAYEGPWSVKFDLNRTNDRKFQGYQDVPLMGECETNLYLATDRYELLGKPYAEQRRLYKVVLLPRQGESLTDIVKQLQPHDIWKLFQKDAGGEGDANAKLGYFCFPRHEIKTELLDLIPMMQHFGCKLPFSGGDFSRLTKEGQVFISQIKQKNYEKTHELGGAGGSATAVVSALESVCSGPSPEYRFVADRPYFELLLDRQSGAVIFAGVTRQPVPIEAPVDPDAAKADGDEGEAQGSDELLCSGDYLDGEPEVIGGGRNDQLEILEAVVSDPAESRLRQAGVSEGAIAKLRSQDCLTEDLLKDADAHFLVAIGVSETDAGLITATFAGEGTTNLE